MQASGRYLTLGWGGGRQGGITVDECYRPELSSWWVRDHVKQGPFEKLRSLECHSYIFKNVLSCNTNQVSQTQTTAAINL